MSAIYFEIGTRAKTVDDSFEVLRKAEGDGGDLLQVIGPEIIAPRRSSRLLNRMERTRDETIKLVQRLFSSKSADAPQVVIFSGAEPGSGCSWVCARVAEIVAAHVEGSVCLVDANFHTESIHRHFETGRSRKVPDERSLLSTIPRNGQPPKGGKLWLLSLRLPTGEWQTPERLDRFQSRLSELRKEFAVILIDAPPINATADAALLGRMADGLVMILQANHTRREAAQRAKEILDAAGVRVLGAVLNKRTFPIPEFLYRRL